MVVNIRYSHMYNLGIDETSSRVKNYQMGLNQNWDWVSPKYLNWDLFPQLFSNICTVPELDKPPISKSSNVTPASVQNYQQKTVNQQLIYLSKYHGTIFL